MDVSIIIVNYNTKKLISDCLHSIYEQTKDIEFEVIVSDNGSVDGSVEMLKAEFPQVVLIENNANLGFGAANNRGLAVAKGKYILYLNSDTILLNNAVKCFFDYWENNPEKENIGALGGCLLDEKLHPNNSYGYFPQSKKIINELIHANYGLLKQLIKRNYNLQKSNEKTNIKEYYGEVEYIIGADLFLLNNKSAYFDENYFLYCEEVDLQLQLKLQNKKRIIIEGPKIIHFEGKSSNYESKEKFPTLTNFSSQCNNISRVYYFKKNNNYITGLIVKILTILLWINPLIYKQNKQALKKLIKI